jgi:hypothetical protein
MNALKTMQPRLRKDEIDWTHDGVGGSRVPPIPSTSLRSALDVRDREVLKDARHRFLRCITDADYAAWARTYGAAFIEQQA